MDNRMCVCVLQSLAEGFNAKMPEADDQLMRRQPCAAYQQAYKIRCGSSDAQGYVKLTSDKHLVTFTSEQADMTPTMSLQCLTGWMCVDSYESELDVLATDFFLAATGNFGFLVECREKTHRFAAETAATREERPEKIAIGEVWMWERRLWWAVPMEQS
eukprot:s2517_g2.t2